MEQEQIARHQEILDLCVAARDVLGHLPAPDAATRKAYFSDENLWSLETNTVCGLVHEYYAGVLACIEQQLTFPAAALTRCVHEVCFRFKYLVEHEGELRDWEEWQLAQDYHLLKASLEHDVGVMIPDGDGELGHMLKGKMAAIEDLLGGPPPQRPHPWRSTSQIFDNLVDVATLPNKRSRGFRRHTIGFFSEYIHPRRFLIPPEDLTLFSVAFSVLLTLRRAMELCQQKLLLSPEAHAQAGKVMEECERLLGD